MQILSQETPISFEYTGLLKRVRPTSYVPIGHGHILLAAFGIFSSAILFQGEMRLQLLVKLALCQDQSLL